MSEDLERINKAETYKKHRGTDYAAMSRRNTRGRRFGKLHCSPRPTPVVVDPDLWRFIETSANDRLV